MEEEQHERRQTPAWNVPGTGPGARWSKGAGRARLLPVKPMLGPCRAGVPGWEEAAPHLPDGVVWEGGRAKVRGRG